MRFRKDRANRLYPSKDFAKDAGKYILLMFSLKVTFYVFKFDLTEQENMKFYQI